MRQNPYGSRTFDNPNRKRYRHGEPDPRHDALFGAAWTLGYAAQTADDQLEALTFAALTGPFGLLAGDAVLPVFHVIRLLAKAAGLSRFAVPSSYPASIQPHWPGRFGSSRREIRPYH